MFGAKDEGKESLLKRVLGVNAPPEAPPAASPSAKSSTKSTKSTSSTVRENPDSGRFNQDSDTPLLSAEEDAGDFQLFSETPKEAQKRDQVAEKAEADKLERAKAEARRNAPDLPIKTTDDTDNTESTQSENPTSRPDTTSYASLRTTPYPSVSIRKSPRSPSTQSTPSTLSTLSESSDKSDKSTKPAGAEVPKNYKEFDKNGNWKITGGKDLGQLLDEFIAALRNKKGLKINTPKGDFHLEAFNGKFCYIDPDGRIRIWEENSVRSVLDRFIVSNNPKIQIVEEDVTDVFKARKIQKDGSLLKPGDYGVFKHKGVFYEGEVASLGKKKVKLKTQSKMYGEQVISLPRESYLAHYAQSPFSLEGAALEKFNREYGSPEEYDNAKKSFMVQSAMRKEKPAREITSETYERAQKQMQQDVENFVGDGRQYSLFDNSDKSNKVISALQKIVDGAEESTVSNLRDDLEQFGGTNDVTFCWGNNKKGIYHIASRRGLNVLLHVIDAVADGKVNRFVKGNMTVVLEKDGYEAVLALTEYGNKKSWLLSGWETNKPDAPGGVGTQSGATQSTPTFSRRELGAGLFDIIQQKNTKVNPDSEKNPENPDIQYSVSPVYTGSAADYDKPSLHYVGSGEGAQVYGWGLYGSSSKNVAKWYAEKDVQHKRHPDVIWDGKPSDKFFRDLRRDGILEKDEKRYWHLSALNLILLDKKGDVDRVIEICRKNIDQAEKFNQKDVAEENRERIKLLEEYRDRIKFHEGNHPSLTINGEKFVKGDIDKGADWEKKMHTFLFSSDGNVSKALRQVEGVLSVITDEDDRKDTQKIHDFLSDKNNKISYDDGTTGRRNLYKQTFWPGKQENLLDWDTIIDKKQHDRIIGQLKKEGLFDKFQPALDYGEELYENLAEFLGSPKAASEFLYRAGIDGVTYIGDDSGVRNYVAFSDKDIQVDDHIKYSLRKHRQVNPIVVNGQVRAEYADLLENKDFTPETIPEWDQKAIAWIDRQGGIEPAAEMIANDTEHSDRHVATLVRRHVLNSEFASSLPDDIRMAVELKNIDEGTAWGREGVARRLAALTLKNIDTVKALFRKLHEKLPDKEKVKLRNKILEQTGVDINNLPDDLVNDKSKLDKVLRAELANTSRWYDKAYEYWINAILSAPTTHSANIIGNTANALYELGPKRFAEAAVNALAKRRDAATFGEFREMWNALDFRSAWKKAKTAFDLETLTPGGKFRENAAVAIPGKLGRAIRTPGRLLVMADAFARELLIPADEMRMVAQSWNFAVLSRH